MHLHQHPLCRFVGLSVCLFVCLSVCRSFGLSDCLLPSLPQAVRQPQSDLSPGMRVDGASPTACRGREWGRLSVRHDKGAKWAVCSPISIWNRGVFVFASSVRSPPLAVICPRFGGVGRLVQARVEGFERGTCEVKWRASLTLDTVRSGRQ
jgi:hypothetical protein